MSWYKQERGFTGTWATSSRLGYLLLLTAHHSTERWYIYVLTLKRQLTVPGLSGLGEGRVAAVQASPSVPSLPMPWPSPAAAPPGWAKGGTPGRSTYLIAPAVTSTFQLPKVMFPRVLWGPGAVLQDEIIGSKFVFADSPEPGSRVPGRLGR